MAKKSYRGTTRSRRLNKSEVARYRRMRARVAEEIPPVKASPEKIAIAKLRAMRQAKGISLGELAARTGITRGNLARLETQKMPPCKLSNAMPKGWIANWKSISYRPA